MSRDRKPRRKPAPAPSKSAGGTLIDIFVGLMLGAVIAAGAAWYFTRANPFQPAPAVPPHASSEGQPPAALPGKPGDRPVVKQDFEFYKILPQGDNVPAKATTPPPTATAGPTPPVVPPTTTPVTPPTPETAQKPTEPIYLQIGAFEDSNEADNLRARLMLAGVDAQIQRGRLPDGRTMNRVRVGPFAKPEDMSAVRSRLAESGFNTVVSRTATP